MSALVVGASGFIGAAALEALADDGGPTRGLFRDTTAAPRHERVHAVEGRLEDGASLARACEGVTAVVHAASYVGSDPDRCTEVNLEGTRRLLAAATSAGVRRVVYVSTTAVYGTGPHRGIAVDGVARHPESAASASRLAAEGLVVEWGGIVVRPNIVHGPGDRWFAPHLVRLTHALGGLVEGGAARISAISVADLGRLLARLAVADVPSGSILHAADPEPATVRELLTRLAPEPDELPLDVAVPFDEAVERAKALGYTSHQVAMIAWDHWYESTAIWSLV